MCTNMHFVGALHQQNMDHKVGAVGAKPDGKQTKWHHLHQLAPTFVQSWCSIRPTLNSNVVQDWIFGCPKAFAQNRDIFSFSLIIKICWFYPLWKYLNKRVRSFCNCCIAWHYAIISGTSAYTFCYRFTWWWVNLYCMHKKWNYYFLFEINQTGYW